MFRGNMVKVWVVKWYFCLLNEFVSCVDVVLRYSQKERFEGSVDEVDVKSR